jgi:hypothetical protein
MNQEYQEFQIYWLENGDITIGKGAWILLRYIKSPNFIRIIDRECPQDWIDRAKDILEKEVNGGKNHE